MFRKGVPVQRSGRVSQNRVQEQCSGTPFGSDLPIGAAFAGVGVLSKEQCFGIVFLRC